MPGPGRFGDFILHERLAVGGMGELFLATREGRPDEPLAVKILLEQFRDRPEYVSMFEDEAKIGLRLAHKNVVGIDEIGTVDDIPYIVMEYVHGENLRAVLRTLYMAREKLDPELALSIAVDTLEGLDHAHRARDENGQRLRLVHRDLSPDNILISYGGEVKILDFGIAKAIGRATETQFGVLKGKAQYMPPEQANGRAVDARSDLFAVGVVLMESLTGEKRFKTEDTLEQYVEAREWQPRAVSDRVPGLPVEIDAIVMKATQPEPSRRFQNADEFAAALTRVLRSGTVPKAREDLPALLLRLFPGRAHGLGGNVTVALPEPSGAIATATDLSAPPRWATDDDDSGVVPAANLATSEAESTRLGPGASVAMLGHLDTSPSIPAPHAPPPRDTRVSVRNLADADPTEEGKRAPIVGAVVVEEAPVRAASAGRTVIRHRRARPRDRAPARRGRYGERATGSSGPLFPALKPPERNYRGAAALVGAVTLIAAVAIALGRWHDARLLAPPATPARTATAPLAAHTPPIPPIPTSRTAPATPAPAATARATRRYAVVHLTSKPSGLTVLIDGVPSRHRTPSALALTPGTHRLAIRARGYRTWTWKSRVRAGDDVRVRATLKRTRRKRRR